MKTMAIGRGVFQCHKRLGGYDTGEGVFQCYEYGLVCEECRINTIGLHRTYVGDATDTKDLKVKRCSRVPGRKLHVANHSKCLSALATKPPAKSWYRGADAIVGQSRRQDCKCI